METGNQKKQNVTDIRREIALFIAHFTILSMLSFAVIYLFFETYTAQSDNINNNIIAYKEILNKQGLLKAKIDTIYNQMTLLNTGKVGNDVFLENYISQNVQETRNIIGNDTLSNFKQYTYLLSDIDSMMILKDSITSITGREQLAYRNLTECMGRMSKVTTALSQDPTRKFQ